MSSRSYLEYLADGTRDIVFGLEDGLVSTVGVLTGIASGTNDHFVVILSGFVLVIVEALSMGVGSFLSAQSEQDMQHRRFLDLQTLVQKDQTKAEKLLKQHYLAMGLSAKEVASFWHAIEHNEQAKIQDLGIHRLGIVPSQSQNRVLNGVFMFVAYILGGAVPILPYFFLPVAAAITFSVPLTVLGLFALGSLKGKLTYKNWWRSGLEMAIVSCSAALLGFVIGKLVAYWWGVTI